MNFVTAMQEAAKQQKEQEDNAATILQNKQRQKAAKAKVEGVRVKKQEEVGLEADLILVLTSNVVLSVLSVLVPPKLVNSKMLKYYQ